MHHEQQSDLVMLDAVTRRNLEIDQTLLGAEDHTLFSVYKSTVTAMGTRQLRRCLHRPINRVEEINARLNAVSELLKNEAYVNVREALRPIADLERICARVALGSARALLPLALLSLSLDPILSRFPNVAGLQDHR